ncbi:MAG: hypothetical protein ACK5Q5_01540 [Planctomycetaceae bacterium]
MPRGSMLRAVCCLLTLSLGLATGAPRPRVLHHPPLDPQARQVELFEALDAGLISAQMRPRSERQGSLFIENLSDQPLTVALPDVIVGVQALPQIGLQFQLPINSGTGFPQNGQLTGQGQAQGQGQTQPVGGTTSRNNSNTGFSADPFFSIPPERIARIDYESVCLQHGATSPRSGSTYQLVRWEEYSDDQRLQSILKQVGRSEVSRRVLQAAAWHLANDLDWDKLAAQKQHHINAPDEPYFQAHELKQARQLVEQATARTASEDSRESPHSIANARPPRE